MKNLLLIAITFFTLNIVAQEKKLIVEKDRTETLADNETKKLTKQLGLNTEQQQKVHAIMLSHFNEELQMKKKMKQKVTSKEVIDKNEVRKVTVKQRQKYSKKLDDQLKEVFTEDQYKNYSAIKLKQKNTKQKAPKKRTSFK
ncbi:hypothetical protein [uncultured Winogradskyella sp.]|uniref:hypothetical protein n=1 Tax=uncultured Winogradskyella sp. TaxID=395353 RepID=UPI002622CC38|nr:hypothetical protein [uncultured Winogradskyella sp.]